MVAVVLPVCGARRGEVVYLSLKSLLGANFASSSASSALRTLVKYVFFSLLTCT